MRSLTIRYSRHFRLQQLADGVYAATHIDGGAAIGSAGIVDLNEAIHQYTAGWTGPQDGRGWGSGGEDRR